MRLTGAEVLFRMGPRPCSYGEWLLAGQEGVGLGLSNHLPEDPWAGQLDLLRVRLTA